MVTYGKKEMEFLKASPAFNFKVDPKKQYLDCQFEYCKVVTFDEKKGVSKLERRMFNDPESGEMADASEYRYDRVIADGVVMPPTSEAGFTYRPPKPMTCKTFIKQNYDGEFVRDLICTFDN